MLRDKANYDVLEGLVSVLLGENITIVELLESERRAYDRHIENTTLCAGYEHWGLPQNR